MFLWFGEEQGMSNCQEKQSLINVQVVVWFCHTVSVICTVKVDLRSDLDRNIIFYYLRLFQRQPDMI